MRAAFVVVLVALATGGCVSSATNLDTGELRTYGGADAPLAEQAPATIQVGPTSHLPDAPPAVGFQAIFTITGPGLRQEEGGLRGGTGTYVLSGEASRPAATSFDWSFGDGSEATGSEQEHAYTELGVYAVKLIVGDASKARAQNVVLLRIAVEPDPWKAVKALVDGVPCDVGPVSGRGTSKNIVDLSSIRFDEKSGHGEIDIRGDVALVGRYVGKGFELVDISDPRNPLLIASHQEGGGHFDVKMTPDRMTATSLGGGIHLTDIRDPGNPVPMSRAQESAHMHYVAHIGGKTYVFVVDGSSGTGVKIHRIDGEPGDQRLTRVAQSLPVEGGPLGPHDIFVNYEADLKKWVLYAADGFHGWLAHDVTDPTKPQLLGGFVNPEAEYVHSIQAAMVGNRRLVVTTSEIGPNLVKVYDATILQAPLLLGVWQNQPGLEPQHDIQIVDGRLFIAHYVYGVYVLDLRNLGIAPVAGTLNLKAIAHWDLNKPAITGFGALDFSGIWDVVVDDGILYMSDMQKGMHVAAFACFEPGNPKFTSIG